MAAVSKQQFKLMKAAENNPELRKEIGISKEAAKEFTEGNVGSKRFSKLKKRIGKKK